MGGLYAGGVLGLAKIFRKFTPQEGQKIILITVGLSDPDEPEKRENIRKAIQNSFHQIYCIRQNSFIFAAGSIIKDFL